MADITQEKAREYMQVAALLNQEFGMLECLVKRQGITMDEMREHVAMILERNTAIIENAAERESRYRASAFVWACVGGLTGG